MSILSFLQKQALPSKFVLRIAFLFLISPISSQAYFLDTGNHSFEKAIDFLESQNIVKGYEDQSFKPEKNLNRAEFTKIIITAFHTEQLTQLDNYKVKCFDDFTDLNAWYVPYVCLAKELELVSGYPDNTFRATNEILFVEAGKVIATTLQKDLTASSDLWYRNYIAELLNKKIVPTDSIESFETLLTRGEMAEMVARALKSQNETLEGYLQYRETRFNEDNNTTWEDFYNKFNSPTTNTVETETETDIEIKKEDVTEALETPESTPEPAPVATVIDSEALLKEAIKQQAIATTIHPGRYIDSNYLTNYSDWTKADYPASLNNDYLSDTEKEILNAKLLRLLNEKRTDWDKPTFVINKSLNQISQSHAEHLVANAIYSHTNITGQDPFDRAKSIGYQGFVTESFVWLQKDPESAIGWWEQSALHWANLMNSKYTNIGIGVAGESNDKLLFVVMTGE